MRTPPPHEPRIARVAAMMADPARSRMLAYLLSGEYASAGELAKAASVTPATASGHLAKLQDGLLVVCESRADVAHALEALSLVAERHTHDQAWAHPERQRLRHARCCYGHLAGQLGVALLNAMHGCGGLSTVRDGYALTPSGLTWLEGLGLHGAMTVPQPRRRFAYPCLDWSERRDHLAGQLAEAIYQHFVDQGWMRRGQGRAVELTPSGVKHLLPVLG